MVSENVSSTNIKATPPLDFSEPYNQKNLMDEVELVNRNLEVSVCYFGLSFTEAAMNDSSELCCDLVTQ